MILIAMFSFKKEKLAEDELTCILPPTYPLKVLPSSIYMKTINSPKCWWPDRKVITLQSEKPVFHHTIEMVLGNNSSGGLRRYSLKCDPLGFVALKMKIQFSLTMQCEHRRPPWLLALGFKLSPASLARLKSCQQHCENSVWETAKRRFGNATKWELGSLFSTECFCQLKNKTGIWDLNKLVRFWSVGLHHFFHASPWSNSVHNLNKKAPYTREHFYIGRISLNSPKSSPLLNDWCHNNHPDSMAPFSVCQQNCTSSCNWSWVLGGQLDRWTYRQTISLFLKGSGYHSASGKSYSLRAWLSYKRALF